MSKKSFVKTISIILSLLILLTVLPLGASAVETNAVTSETVRDVTLEVTENTEDARVRTEEGSGLNTIVVDNGDGTHTMTLYDYPVKFVNEKGEIEDISLEIASVADGSYKTKANDIQTVFPKKISDGITLSGKGVSVKLIPTVQPPSEREVAAKPAEGVTPSVSLTLNSSLNEGAAVGNDTLVVPSIGTIIADSTVTKLDNETVSYYYDNKTTLEYSLTYTGFKEDIVVSEYTGQTEYHFLIETGGLTLTKLDKSYYLTDENGEIKATLGDIIIFTADERNNALGSMTHETVKENEQYIITIHVDADYLKDEKTVYPIRIDPTIEITYDNNGSSAIQDVTINQNSGSSGTSGSLYVGKRNTYGISRTLMKFPGLNLGAISSANNITSAYVEIRDMMCETTSMTVYGYIFDGNSWSESTANWSNVDPNSWTEMPSAYAEVCYSNGASKNPAHRYSINITQAVKSWKTGFYDQAKGIMLRASDDVEYGSALYKTFASYNRASNKPSLKVNYNSTTTHTGYGWLGFVNSDVINGWVWCSGHETETLNVQVDILNTTTGQSWQRNVKANLPRPDVEEAGYGTGNYGFSIDMNNWLSYPEGNYVVSAQAILPSGAYYTLHASPKAYSHTVVKMNETSLLLDIGETYTLYTTSSLSTVTNSTITWTSDDPTVVSVSNGTITGVSKGVATVTATYQGFSDYCVIAVSCGRIYIDGFDYDYISVADGRPVVVKCDLQDYGYTITWSSDSEELGINSTSGHILKDDPNGNAKTGIVTVTAVAERSDDREKRRFSKKFTLYKPSIGITDEEYYHIMGISSSESRVLSSNNGITSNILSSSLTNDDWKMKYNDGTYHLINRNNNEALSLNGTSLTTTAYSAIDNSQKFTVYRIDSGQYQGLFVIRHGFYYVAMSSTGQVSLDYSPNANVYWSFMEVDKDFVRYYSIVSPNTYSEASNIYTSFTGKGYLRDNSNANHIPDDYEIKDVNHCAPAETAYEHLSDGNNDILIYVCHGVEDEHYSYAAIDFQNTDGTTNGRIAATQLTDYEQNYYYVDELPDNSLSNARCVLLLGCKTGVTYDASDLYPNLVKAYYDAGAHFVLGTNDLLYYEAEVVPFLQGFTTELNNGGCINDCVNAGISKIREYLNSSDFANDQDIPYKNELLERLAHDAVGNEEGRHYDDFFYCVGDGYQYLQ